MKASKDLSPQEFFDSLNFAQLPEADAKYIKEEILNTEHLKRLKKDSEEFTMIVNLINESFPAALAPTAKKEPEAVVSKKESKPVLVARLGVLKDLLAKNPNDKTLNTRIKLVEEMIESK